MLGIPPGLTQPNLRLFVFKTAVLTHLPSKSGPENLKMGDFDVLPILVQTNLED